MRRPAAAWGSGLFFALAPGTVAGLLPWTLTGWRTEALLSLPLRLLVAVLLAAGLLVIVPAFVRFVIDGAGTPAPVAETEHLVVTGPYRFVRNPMYVAVTLAIAGQALLLGSWTLTWYAAAAAAAMAAFAKLYEEPRLAARFGEEYAIYRRAVPGWWPRLRPSPPDR